MKKLALICVLTFATTAFSITAKAGDWSSGGGDQVAQEFVTLGYDLYRFFGFQDEEVIRRDYGVKSLYSFAQTLHDSKVRSEEHVYLDGMEVDAVNDPAHKTILVNRSRWRQAETDVKRAPIVLHEYHGVAHIDDGNYQYSHHLVGAYSPVGKLNPPMPTFKNNAKLILDPQRLPDDFEIKAEKILKDEALYYFGGIFSMSARGVIELDNYKLESEKLSIMPGQAKEYIAKRFGIQRDGCLANAIWNLAAMNHQFLEFEGFVAVFSQQGEQYGVTIIGGKTYLSIPFEDRIKKFLPRLRELAMEFDTTCGG